ncbi:MAG: Gfo/Idh/MocA family oxidoreductase [Eubacteriales bacterium]|nr:Gfo/Idh/MocA family oxidoreductase [Clostridiales bacterium]MDD7775089.1 Gfo/Idh/MocA family oxidoreductase [Eubacteriales bacterium]MDY3941036.1 Gfo/Idh/MocA family oxidoreductase [Eubacteriales bacterium]
MSDKVLSQFKQEAVEEKKAAGKKFKIGIIGTGWIAESHIQSYKNQPDVEIVAAADLIPGKAEKFMERYGVTGVHFYKDHKELIDNEPDLDGVSICTYNTQHAAPAIYCMEHNIPVLLEKPFTVTLEEAEAVCKAEKESSAFITVGFQPRFDVNMQQIKKIVDSGVLGKIYYIQTGGGRRRGIPGSTFIEKSTGGIGALGDIGCYSLDMVLNAIGYPKPLTVSGYASDYFGKNPKYNGKDADRFSVDDFAAAFVRLEGGIILDFRIAWAMHVNTPGDTIIFGTEGALRIPSTDCWNGSVGGPMTLYHDVAGVQVDTVIPILNNTKGGLFDQKIRSFLDAIATNGPAPVPTSQILYNQAIIDGINKSNACGHEIEIKFAD